MDSLLDRLKQRKVFQWTVAYVAGAWVTVQVMDVIAEPWGLTAGLVRSAQAILALGLPLVLVLAWYHGEQGRQRVSAPESLPLPIESLEIPQLSHSTILGASDSRVRVFSDSWAQ